jgi:hypothetical protein
MYDGFERDLADALERGESAIGDFIHQTARDRNVDSFDVFAEVARRRLAWDRGEASEASPTARRRRGSRQRAVGGVLRQFLSRRGRRGLVGRATRYAVGAAWRGVKWSSTKGRKQAVRATRRAWKATRRQAKRLARWSATRTRRLTTQARKAGKWAFPIVYRLWTGKQLSGKASWPLVYQLWTGKKWKPRFRRQPKREVPAPGPALATYLAGATEREATYTTPDPSIRNPNDDWVGALHDFRAENRKYVFLLQKLLQEEPTKKKEAA